MDFWYTMNKYKDMRNSIVTAVLMTLFLGVMFGGLFHMSGMDMAGDMSGCPYMTHEEVLCSMSIFDHFAAWESHFLALVPQLTVLLLAAAAILTVARIAPHLLSPPRRLHAIPIKQYRDRTYTFSYRPLQELFSRGILHPKLF